MAPPAPQNRPPQSNGPRQRILRIGVLLGGKIVEERLIRERTPVTIGQSMRNTFSIPVEGLPLELTLFSLEQGRYSLRFLNNMDGRVSDGANVQTLDALKGRGAHNRGAYWEVPLPETSRGKLSLGDLTVLFQFVTEPPRQPKPMLPASVRGTFADRFDPRLLVILGVSIVLHFAIAIVALTRDVDTGDDLATRAYNYTFKQDTYQVDLQQPKPQPVDQGSAAGSAVPAPKPEPSHKAKGGPSKKPDKDTGRDAKQDVALQEQEAAALVNELVADGPNGTSEGDMSHRRPGADLDQEVQSVRDSGQHVAVGGGAGHGSRGNGDARVGTGHGPNIAGAGGVESAGGGKGSEKAPSGRISVGQLGGDTASVLNADAVLKKIKSAYLPGIQHCYKVYLNSDATARGKVTLSFTINASGRTLNGKASGVADQVDACIQSQMALWHFTPPKDKSDGTATSADFAITLALQPD